MLDKEVCENAAAATRAFCKAEVAAGHCMPDQCELCPAQQFLDMVDELLEAKKG